MNEQAQQLLVDLIQKASNGIDGAVAFSQAQIPDVVHQLLVWNFASSIITQVVCVLVITSIVFVILKSISDRKKGEEWTSGDYGLSSIAFDAVIFICSIVITPIAILVFLFNFDWLKIWLAPKLYLIEYAASLVK